MNTALKTTRIDFEPRASATLALLLAVVVTPDLPEPLPFWPETFGQAPSVGAVLLIAALVMALVSFDARYFRSAR